jgi:hypothetical protein
MNENKIYGAMICRTCGMSCKNLEYHPYAACLMFQACKKADVVRENLNAVRLHGYQEGRAVRSKLG